MAATRQSTGDTLAIMLGILAQTGPLELRPLLQRMVAAGVLYKTAANLAGRISKSGLVTRTPSENTASADRLTLTVAGLEYCKQHGYPIAADHPTAKLIPEPSPTPVSAPQPAPPPTTGTPGVLTATLENVEAAFVERYAQHLADQVIERAREILADKFAALIADPVSLFTPGTPRTPPPPRPRKRAVPAYDNAPPPTPVQPAEIAPASNVAAITPAPVVPPGVSPAHSVTHFHRIKTTPRPVLPRVLVVGLLDGQKRMMSTEFGAVLDLKMPAKTIVGQPLRMMADNAATVIIMTNFVDHAHQNTVRHHPGLVLLSGGMTALRGTLAALAGLPSATAANA